MSNVRFLPIAILTALTVSGFAQSNSTPPPPPPASQQASSGDTGKGHLPSIMGGIGVMFMNGNVGTGTGVTAYSTIRGGYTLGIEERPVSFLGIELDGIIGKLAASERSNDTADNLNYQTNIIQVDLRANLHLDGLILKPTAPIAPFITVGFSFMSYSKYTELYNAQGDQYYYWTDGSIREKPQTAYWISQGTQANNYWVTQRSYNYNTKIGSGTTECVPVGLGMKFKITDNLAVNAQAAYYFTFSDGMENYVSQGAKDAKYLYTFATIEWHFTKPEKYKGDESRYPQNFDPAWINDDVKKEAPDAKHDRELDSLETAHAGDTASIEHSDAFNLHPTQSGLDSLSKKQQGGGKTYSYDKLPPRFRPADYNHDGYISPQEISKAIDDFFEGTSPMTIEDINALIDYFFDQ